MLQFQNIISNKTTTQLSIEQFANEYQYSSMYKLTQLLIYAHHVLLSEQSLPCCKKNILYFLIHLVKKCHYPSLQIIQHIFLQLLEYPARVAVRGDSNQMYDYFKNPDNQVQSYNFTTNSLLLFYLLASIKPKKMYRTRQINNLSKAKKLLNRLISNEEEKNQNYEKLIFNQLYKFSDLRKVFFTNLNVFNKNSHPYIDFFIEQMQTYISKSQTTLSFSWLKNIAIQGDHYLSRQSIFRLSQIIISHASFHARKRCLQIFTQFLQNGSLLALIILNFTENFMKLFLQIEKMKEAKTQATFFPKSKDRIFKNKDLQRYYCLNQSFGLSFPAACKNNTLIAAILLFINSTLIFVRLVFLFKLIKAKHFQQQAQQNKLMISQLQKVPLEEVSSPNVPDITLELLTASFQKHKQLYKYIASFQIFLLPSQFQELLFFRRKLNLYTLNLDQQLLQTPLFEKLAKDMDQLIAKIGNLQEIYNYQTSQKTFQTKQLDKQLIKCPLAQFKICSPKYFSPIALTKQSEQLQKKLYLKMKQLASNRSLILWQISSLQLHSRPYLAYNLHSKQIKQNLLPIVRYNPLRSAKRLKAGIKLVESQDAQFSNIQMLTPKFRSVLVDQQNEIVSKQKSKLGLRLIKNRKKYIRYLSYLRKKQAIIHFTNQHIVILKNSELTISRSSLVLQNNKVIVKYFFQCSQKSHLVSYMIKEQPSICLRARLQRLNDNFCQITVQGTMAKFGYKLPTIVFYIRQQFVRQVPLPFAFNNFLSISPPQQISDCTSSVCFQTCILDTSQFSDLVQVKKYLRGAELIGDTLRGFVQFHCWQSILQIHLNNSRFIVKTLTKNPSNNVLFEFLPSFLAEMFGRVALTAQQV